MNNKSLTIFNIVLLVAVLVLFILQFKGGKNSTEVIATTKEKSIKPKLIDSSGASFKVAYVNSDTVASYFNFSKAVTANLKAKQSSAEIKLKELYGKYEKERKSFEAQAPIMGQEELQRKAQEIGMMEQTIMQQEQELSAALAQKEAEVMTDYVYQTDKFMQLIGAELGYDYVMSYRVGGPMLYANPDLDITNQVIELLNVEYEKSKTKTSK